MPPPRAVPRAAQPRSVHARRRVPRCLPCRAPARRQEPSGVGAIARRFPTDDAGSRAFYSTPTKADSRPPMKSTSANMANCPPVSAPSAFMMSGAGFASARLTLPLVGKGGSPLSPHHLQGARQASARQGCRRKSNRGRSRCVEEAPIASDPAPDQQRAAITPTQESSVDVSAREPDTLVANPAVQGGRRRSDDPDVRERHEIIGVVLDHGTCLLSESAPGTRAFRDDASSRDRAAGL